MTTTAELTTTLASALGLPRRLAEETARHLREARMLPAPENPANIRDGVTLLLGLMAAPTPADAADCARLYRQLPFAYVNRAESIADGRTELVATSDPAELVVKTLHEHGETFGKFLELMIEAAGVDDSPIKPHGITVGGGPGTATGFVTVVVEDPAGSEVVGYVTYNLEPLGGGRRPDDAPRARLDCSATVPGSIFEVFHELFPGRSGGLSADRLVHADAAHLEQGS